MFRKKTIASRRIWEIKWQHSSKWEGLFRVFVVVFCIILVWFFGKQIIKGAQIIGNQIGKWAVTIVSESLGTEMKKDEMGNINIMIIGYGGQWHAWSNLADAIMVASWNPKVWAVTMLSVPRDLYVNTTGTHIKWRINEVFAIGMWRKQMFETWARYVSQQLEEMMGIEIPYYALIDFAWFEWVIDSLWGIDVFVEKPIFDPTYPSSETNIMTFQLGSWWQHLDGATALMYSRSRHSTSDFARSARQQDIVKAVLKKLSSKDILLNPSKIKSLYKNYTAMVKTNITADEMVWMSRYAYDLKHIFSFGLTTNCSNARRNLSVPACFLISPPRELFAGAAVMIPIGPSNDPSFYDYIRKFSFYIFHNQDYLIEDAKIVIQNWIDKNYAKKLQRKPDWYANKIGVKLKKYWFNIINAENTNEAASGTIVYVVGQWEYQHTIETLKYFIPIDSVVEIQGTWQQITSTSWVNLIVVLGNTYLDRTDATQFSYYK